jgi:hypothetical protein
MAKTDENRLRRPKARRGNVAPAGWAVYAPMGGEGIALAGGGVAPGVVEPSDPTARIAARDSYEAHLNAIKTDYRGRLAAEAHALLSGREAQITTASGTLRARLIRFRIGAVFEHETWKASGGLSHGKTRIDREQLAVPLLMDYLARDLARMTTPRSTDPG